MVLPQTETIPISTMQSLKSYIDTKILLLLLIVYFFKSDQADGGPKTVKFTELKYYKKL